jgi:hypothetical protein
MKAVSIDESLFIELSATVALMKCSILSEEIGDLDPFISYPRLIGRCNGLIVAYVTMTGLLRQSRLLRVSLVQIPENQAEKTREW